MGTAPKKSRAARQVARRAADANVPASIEFLIFADNGGSYHSCSLSIGSRRCGYCRVVRLRSMRCAVKRSQSVVADALAASTG